jgi:putative redox protein
VSEPFEIESRRGHRLAGRLERPEGGARGWAVFAHCFTCDKDGHAAVRICRGLAERGIGALRFDFSGLGASGGTFGKGLAADVEDVTDAVAAMRAADLSVDLLIGHSFGGAAAIAAACDLPEIRAVVTIGSPFKPDHILRHFKGGLFGAKNQAVIDGRTFRFGSEFVADLKRHDQASRIARLKRPLMVMHAPLDSVVGAENAGQIFSTAKHPKSFVSLDDANHLLTDAEDAAWAAGIIAAWAGKYL